MRRRKKRIAFAAFVSIILIIFAVIYSKNVFRNFGTNANNTKNNVTSNKNETKNLDINKQESKAPAKQEKIEGYPIQLSDGTTVNAIYETKNNDKTFKNISPAESNIQYNISPAGKNIVLFDSKVQSIILMDISGNKQDITNPQYVSTSGTVITKSSQLSAQPGYIWCSAPKFIDEDNIAYISQLPWIGKTTKYVWIENIKNKTHTWVQGIEGEDVKLDKLTDKGLTVIVDGKTIYLTSNGSITE
nr:hypothetical protein [Clostridium aciditolerans]